MVRSKLIPLAFPVFIVGVLVAAFLFRDPLSELVETPETLERSLEELGPAGPLALIAIQFFQVVVFIVPGDVVQLAAGYVYGVAGGAALSVAGILLGSGFNYLVGRLLGRAFVERIVADRVRTRLDRLSDERGPRTAFFLLFVIPGLPKDVLCYVAGATVREGGGIGFPLFIAASMVGRLPGIIGSALIGANAAAGRPVVAVAIFGLAVTLLVLGVRFQQRLEKALGAVIARIESHRARRRDR